MSRKQSVFSYAELQKMQSVSADESFCDFYDAVNFKKREGWKSQKHRGEWEDVCPVCQEVEK